MKYGDKIIYFLETTDGSAEENNFFDTLLGDKDSMKIDYVVIPGVGRSADYTGINVKGKIALVRRGSNTFEEKALIAEAQGAAGIIVYNNGDVYEGEWYAKAVAWAYEAGVVTGDTNAKKFFPNADVTREQLALMMYRYASCKDYDVTSSSDLAGLQNAENVSNWAADGVKWAVGSGLISGIEKDGVKDLAPQGNASRAQVAAILQRFCENYK